MEYKNIIAKTFHGLEDVLADELRQLGATNITPLRRAVKFDGDKALLYRANICLRTAIKLLVPIAKFRASNQAQLYQQVIRIKWAQYMRSDSTFLIDAVINTPHFDNSHFVALKVKDAIVDQFRAKTGDRPSISKDSPDLRLSVHCMGDEFSLLLDSSGDSLFKRGYRTSQHVAPLNEVLAAGMLALSGWDAKSPLVDIMCGSGTILIEAAMLALKIPAGFFRHGYGFNSWTDFDAELYGAELEKAKRYMSNKLPDGVVIQGTDNSLQAFNQAKENLVNAGLQRHVQLFRKPFAEYPVPMGKPGMILTNPPYGERLEQEEIELFYKSIGDKLKSEFEGWQGWIISSNMRALKFVGLRPSQKIMLYNGALECRFCKYEMYKGSKRERLAK